MSVPGGMNHREGQQTGGAQQGNGFGKALDQDRFLFLIWANNRTAGARDPYLCLRNSNSIPEVTEKNESFNSIVFGNSYQY